MRREKLLMFGGITTDRRVDHMRRARQPNSARFCDSTPPFRPLQAVRRLQLAMGASAKRLLHPTPGPSVAANYTGHGHRRPLDRRQDGRAPDIAVNLIEPNTVFLDQKNQLDMRLGRNCRSERDASEFADIFKCSTPARAARHETYGAKPATNAWMTPTGIMDGRYVRFGISDSKGSSRSSDEVQHGGSARGSITGFITKVQHGVHTRSARGRRGSTGVRNTMNLRAEPACEPAAELRAEPA